MIEDEIRALEQSLLTPTVRSSAEELDRVLSDDFLEFGSSGRAYTKEQVIPLALGSAVISADLHDFRAVVVAPGIAHTRYRCGGTPIPTGTNST